MTTIRPDLSRVIEDLRRRLKALETANRPMTSINGDDGRFRIVRSDGTAVATIGDIGMPLADGSVQSGAAFYRHDGTVAFSVADPEPVSALEQTATLWDRQGNAVVSDDGPAGQGLRRPWLPLTLSDVRTTVWPSTTSATFTNLLYGLVNVQHPYVRVIVQAQTGTATVGEYQLLGDGAPLGNVVQVAAATNQDIVWHVPLAGYFGAEVSLAVSARRVSGANAVTCQLYGAWGTQTPTGT